MQADGLQPIDASSTGAATGEDMPKTEGIPNYMIRNTGTVARIAEGPDSATAVLDDGALYESGRLVSLVTSDVIDMVQQQGGAAEAVDYLGENILVEGLLFDDFRAEAVFDVASPDAPDDVVTLEVVEARPSSDLVLAQIADDEAKRESIASFLSLAVGFTGWTARVVTPGRVRAGFTISKREVVEEESPAA